MVVKIMGVLIDVDGEATPAMDKSDNITGDKSKDVRNVKSEITHELESDVKSTIATNFITKESDGMRDLSTTRGDLPVERNWIIMPKEGKKSKASNYHWTAAEHEMFLLGMSELGRGSWTRIAEEYVSGKTPTQVASHAQKYFHILQNPPCIKKRKHRRTSIFDMQLPPCVKVGCSNSNLISESKHMEHSTHVVYVREPMFIPTAVDECGLLCLDTSLTLATGPRSRF